MKKKNNIIILLSAFGFLASCQNDEIIRFVYTVGETDNAIVLQAGIGEKSSDVHTRADGGYDDIDAANHSSHVLFSTTANSKMALRVDGKWKGKADGTYTKGSIIKGSISSEIVTQTTTATIKGETETGSKHNVVEFSSDEQLYWDDYGTAVPNNMVDGEGRKTGLTMYAVAVDGVTTAPTVTDWSSLSWNVGSVNSGSLDQSGSNYWKNQDLLISNNVKTGGPDDTYKFDERASGKLLEFKHAMSKITFRLIADEGFPTTGNNLVGATTRKFETAPEVKLTTNKTGQSNNEWANTACTVNVIDGGISNTGTPAVITMHKADVTNSNYTVIYDALVAPGSCFGTTNEAIIGRINADGNIYYVSAEKIRTKLHELNSSTDYKTEAGKNYVITVNVKKTKIEVSATIQDWIDVTADPETPKINVVANVGDATAVAATKDRMPSFDFYLSDAAGANASTAYEKKATATKPTEGADGATVWALDNPLYWPNHQTHYFMRGVSPINTSVSSGKITVSSIDYDAAATSMSNLLVGAPVIAQNTMCGNSDHSQVDMSTGGICAREGKINLTFNYMMSQLEVRLTTAASTAPEYVNLTNAKVELVNAYNAGQVDIHNKTVTTTGNTDNFEVKHVGSEDANYRHSAVVPQNLTFTTAGATSNLRFKITIYKNGVVADGVDDIYFADVKPIKVKEPGDSESKEITKWDSGKHYIYTLDLKKTEIKVTATIADWITVTASEDVWF